MYKEAIKTLKKMREKLLEVFETGESCRTYYDEAIALSEELEAPQFPKFERKNENKRSAEYDKYLAQARQRSQNKRPAKIVSSIISAIIIAFAAYSFAVRFLAAAPAAQLESIDISSTLVLMGAIVLLFVILLVQRCFEELDITSVLLSLFSHIIISVFLGLLVLGMLIKAIPAITQTVGFIMPAIIIIAFVGSFALSGIFNLINSLIFKYFKPNAAQAKRLAELAKEDEKARAENDIAEKAYIEQKTAEHKAELPNLARKLDKCLEKLENSRKKYEKLCTELDKMDDLSQDDKNINMIDSLICILSDRRADTIKEALQQYDIMAANRQLLELEQQRLKLQEQYALKQDQEILRQRLAEENALELQRQQLRAYNDIRDRLNFVAWQMYLKD